MDSNDGLLDVAVRHRDQLGGLVGEVLGGGKDHANGLSGRLMGERGLVEARGRHGRVKG